MAGRLSGQSAVITGAGRGFGRAIAERLAGEGAAVALVSRSQEQLDEVADGIRANGGTAVAIAADLFQPADIAAACAKAKAELGQISLLVSNAGVPGPFGPVWDSDPEEWWKSQSLHIRAPYLLMQNLMPDMIARKQGRVICISALASVNELPFLSAYSVGKAALNKLVAMAAAESAEHNVQVFAVEPGFVPTQLGEDTAADPLAQKYFPHLLEGLENRKNDPEGYSDLDRTAERCLVLAAGDYDALSGRYMELPDPIDDWKAEAEAAAKEDA